MTGDPKEFSQFLAIGKKAFYEKAPVDVEFKMAYYIPNRLFLETGTEGVNIGYRFSDSHGNEFCEYLTARADNLKASEFLDLIRVNAWTLGERATYIKKETT